MYSPVQKEYPCYVGSMDSNIFNFLISLFGIYFVKHLMFNFPVRRKHSKKYWTTNVLIFIHVLNILERVRDLQNTN